MYLEGALCGHRPYQVQAFLHYLLQRDRLEGQREAPRLDTGDIEHLVDKSEQV